MKIRCFLLSASLVLLGLLPALASAQQPEMAQLQAAVEAAAEGNAEAASALADQAAAACGEGEGAHQCAFATRFTLANHFMGVGQPQQAQTQAAAAMAAIESQEPVDEFSLLTALSLYASTSAYAEDWPAAEKALERGRKIEASLASEAAENEKTLMAESMAILLRRPETLVHEKHGRYDEAIAAQTTFVAAFEKHRPDDPVLTGELYRLASLQIDGGDRAGAEATARRVLSLAEAQGNGEMAQLGRELLAELAATATPETAAPSTEETEKPN